MTPGAAIAHYRITSKLGEGGMGQVYRAVDTRLHRDVAIKVLPPALSGDAQYMARFEREAQTLAALNHPNIATIYGIEHGAIVMELVEGETPAGQIAVETAIEYARQIAAGLEAAHEKGIVHRDLKPANVKVTSEGVVKLLDFGLAKAYEGTAVSATISPTLSLAMTQAGMILGTAAYMAPEQARGKPVDKRADIWAFGVVLYEMLTGRQLFGGGETITDTLASVVKDAPDLAALPPGTPPRVRRLLERCLRKDPRQRLRDIGEARVILDEPESHPAAAAAREKAPRRRVLAWALGAAIPLAAAAGWWARPAPRDRALPVKFDIVAPAGGELLPVGHAISPDGTQIVLRMRPSGNERPRLYLRQLNGTDLRELPGTGGANRPAWSPNGKSIVFAAGGKWQRLDLAGGSPRALCDASPTVRGAAWSERGVILIAQVAGPLLKIPDEGGTPVATTRPDESSPGHSYPHFLPGGRFFIYTERVAGSSAWLADLDGKEPPKRLVHADGSEVVYAAGPSPGAGMLLFRRGDSLMGARFDEERRAVVSDPLPVLDRVEPGSLNDLAVTVSAPARVMLAAVSPFSGGEELATVDRNGKKTATLTPAGETGWGHLEFSPDGKRLLGSRGSAGATDLWSVDLARGTVSRITSTPSVDKAPAWSPDGRKVYYMSMRGETAGLWVIASDGTGQPELLLNVTGHHIGASPSGRHVAFENRTTDQSLSLLDLSRPGKAEPLIGGAATFGWPQFSPDGRWLAYVSNETGRQEVYIQSFPPGRGKTQVSRDGGRLARWRADGKELVFVAGSGAFYSASIRPRGEELAVEPPVKLFEIAMSERAGATYFALSPDGQRIALNLAERNARRPLTVMVDWMAGLGLNR